MIQIVTHGNHVGHYSANAIHQRVLQTQNVITPYVLILSVMLVRTAIHAILVTSAALMGLVATQLARVMRLNAQKQEVHVQMHLKHVIMVFVKMLHVHHYPTALVGLFAQMASVPNVQ